MAKMTPSQHTRMIEEFSEFVEYGDLDFKATFLSDLARRLDIDPYVNDLNKLFQEFCDRINKKPACESCKYAKKTGIIQDDIEQIFCLYNPPVTMAFPEQGLMGKMNIKFMSIYPNVSPESFCHNYEVQNEQ